MISVSFRRSHAGTIARAAFEIFERLESRTLLSVSVSTPIQPQALSINATASLDLFRNFTDPNADPVATVTTDQVHSRFSFSPSRRREPLTTSRIM